jgi:hypothetical protein
MTTLDIFQIVFIVIVFAVGLIGFIKAATKDD